MQRLFNRLTGIEPSERGMIALLLALSFSLGGALVFVDIAARALFLYWYPVTLLPWAYLGAAIVIPLTGFAYRALQRRLTVAALTMGMLVLLCLSTLAFWISTATFVAAWPIFALFIWYRLLYAYNGLLLYGVAGQLFTLRQGKRLFGMIGTGEPIAGVIGYFSAALLAQTIGTANMLLIAVLLLAASMVIMIRLMRATPQLRETSLDERSVIEAQQRSSAGFGRYVVLLSAIAIVSILFYLLSDYGFSAESGLVFTDADQLATFFGIFFGMVAIGRIMTRSFITGWVLNRFGLRVGLLVMPVAIICCVVALLIAGPGLGVEGAIFFFMALTRFSGSILYPSIQRAAMQVLYQPLPLRRRLALQTTVESIIEPVSIGLGSMVLISLTLVGPISTSMIAALILAIMLILAVIAYFMLRDYRSALSRALARRLLEGGNLSFHDASSRAVIERTLASPHPGEVVYALDLLSRASPPELLLQRIPALLIHPDPRVRAEAARHAGAAGAVSLLEVALDDVDPRVSDTALAALLREHDPAVAQDAVRRLHSLVYSPESAQRSRAAAIIGRIVGTAGSDELRLLLIDADTDVRRAALRAAGASADDRLLPTLLAALAQPDMRAAALAALVDRGSVGIPAIAAHFTVEGAPLPVLARICGRIGGAEAGALLLQHLAHPHDEVRHAVALALRRSGYRPNGADIVRVREQIRIEVDIAAWMLQARTGIGPSESLALLRDALDDTQVRLRRRIFALLELLHDPVIVRRIQRHLDSPLTEKRDYAFELFEVHITDELRQYILPLIDSTRPLRSVKWQLPHTTAAWVRMLGDPTTAGTTPWLRICARYVAGYSGESDTIVARVLLLRNSGIFAATPDDMLAEIAMLMLPVAVAPQTQIFAAGDQGDHLYVVVDGEIRIHNDAHTIALLGTGDVFGEMALLDVAPRTASATTGRTTQLLRLEREPFYELVEDRIEIAHGVIKMLTARLRTAVHALDEAHRSQIQG